MSEMKIYNFAVADIGDFDLDQDRSIDSSIAFALQAEGLDCVVCGHDYSQSAFEVHTRHDREEVKNALERQEIFLDE